MGCETCWGLCTGCGDTDRVLNETGLLRNGRPAKTNSFLASELETAIQSRWFTSATPTHPPAPASTPTVSLSGSHELASTNKSPRLIWCAILLMTLVDVDDESMTWPGHREKSPSDSWRCPKTAIVVPSFADS